MYLQAKKHFKMPNTTNIPQILLQFPTAGAAVIRWLCYFLFELWSLLLLIYDISFKVNALNIYKYFLFLEQVRDIKFLNNISDSGINSRERLLIPIINPNSLINGICYIESDTYAKKEVLVLYPGGQPDKKLVSKGSSIL